MYPFIAKHLVYYPIQYFRGQEVKEYLTMIEGNQFLSLDQIYSIRDEKVRKIVIYAYDHIPYYRETLDRVGVHPCDVRGFDDLASLPVLSKHDILNNIEKMINKDLKQRYYKRKTSGSTGITLSFQKEASALAFNDAIMYRCYQWYGIDIGDRQVRFWGVPVAFSDRLKEKMKDIILNRIRISAFNISETNCLSQYKRIKAFKPTYFYGYTTAIYGFCMFAKKLGLNLKKLNLKAVICTAEKMYKHHSDLFNEVFDCPVIDEYGSSENGIIAFQCPKGNMHMMADHLGIEILNEQGVRVQPGDLGHIVVTDLVSYAMPLIRYEIGDFGRYTEKTCSCGVNLPLMEMIEGRKEDFIYTKSGKLIHAAYLCYTLKDDSVREFKMYQNSMDRFLVQIVKSPLFGPDTEDKLEKNLRSALGNEIHIKFEYLDRIPREKSGKLRYFISDMNK